MKTIITYLALVCITFSLYAQTTILEEGFESGTFPPTGWVSYRGVNDVGSLNDWVPIIDNQNNTRAFSRYSEHGIGIAEDWLVTPLINLTNSMNAELRFFAKETYGNTWLSQYDIRVSINSQDIHDHFNTIATYNNFDRDNYEEIVLDLSAYDGQQIFIAFVHVDEFQDDWFLDDITITSNENCNALHVPNTYSSNLSDLGQSFTAECNGNLEYVQYFVHPNLTGTVLANTLYIYEGNTNSGTPIYTQDFPDTTTSSSAPYFRVMLNQDVPMVAGNQYTFETSLGGNVYPQYSNSNYYSNGNAYFNGNSISIADIGFAVSITEEALSVGSYDNVNKIDLYPNPTTDYITISGNLQSNNYTLYDISGKIIGKSYYNNKEHISVKTLEKGMYFLKFENHKTLKFIKK